MKHQHTSNRRRHERAVAAELNRPLTQAEFDDLQEEIREAMGMEQEEEIEDETNTPRPLTLIWCNPNPPVKGDCAREDDDIA